MEDRILSLLLGGALLLTAILALMRWLNTGARAYLAQAAGMLLLLMGLASMRAGAAAAVPVLLATVGSVALMLGVAWLGEAWVAHAHRRFDRDPR